MRKYVVSVMYRDDCGHHELISGVEHAVSGEEAIGKALSYPANVHKGSPIAYLAVDCEDTTPFKKRLEDTIDDDED